MHMQTLKELDASDFDKLALHIDRQIAESGSDGRPRFSPLTGMANYATPERREKFETSIAIPVGTPGWTRCWGLVDNEGNVVGHLDLNASSILSAQHRVSLGIGLESTLYGQGRGRSLIDHAIRFARDHGIEWIDLQVFAENFRAVSLYRSMGFTEIGRRVDSFRIDGRSADDLMMSLRLTPRDSA